jgi:YD repeat-containing protein
MIERTAVRTNPGNALKAVLLVILCALAFAGRSTHAQAPVISSVSPSSGYAAQNAPIEIIGSNFGTSGTVTFNGTPVTRFSYWGANTIVPFIPSGATSGPLVVTTSVGSSGTSTTFTILSSLSITSVSPSSVPAGTPMTISGTNLTGCSDVIINPNYQWVNSSSTSSTITASVPWYDASGSYSVMAICNGLPTNSLPFTILPPPTLTAISPGAGQSGTVLTLTGTELSSCTTVSLGGTQVAGTATATSITATLPTETHAGYISASAICSGYQTNGVWFLVHTPYDNGTMALTVNGVTDSVPYALSQNATSAAVTASLISTINADPNAYVNASASGSAGITLTSRDPGAASDFAFSLVDNYDTWDFSTPSFVSSPSSGELTGGNNATFTTGVGVYSYSITGYDPDGNLLSYADSVMGSWSFGYDPLNRLTSAAVSSGYYMGTNIAGATLGWTYDEFGNRLTQSSNSGALPTGSTQFTGANNQATGTGLASSPNQSTITLQYDPAGNLNGQNGNIQSIYDAEGRLCATQSNTGGYEGYIYDAGGNRVAKGTINTLSCDTTANGFALVSQYLLGPSGEQMTELNATGAWVHTNVTANGSLFATFDNDNKGAHFYLTDWLGTRRVQTNYIGAVENTWVSLPYGDGLAASNQSRPNRAALHRQRKRH